MQGKEPLFVSNWCTYLFVNLSEVDDLLHSPQWDQPENSHVSALPNTISSERYNHIINTHLVDLQEMLKVKPYCLNWFSKILRSVFTLHRSEVQDPEQ